MSSDDIIDARRLAIFVSIAFLRHLPVFAAKNLSRKTSGQSDHHVVEVRVCLQKMHIFREELKYVRVFLFENFSCNRTHLSLRRIFAFPHFFGK